MMQTRSISAGPRNGLGALAACVLLAAAVVQAAEYHVGPDQLLKTVGEAPWATLSPGDTVLIHWRAEAYREKWTICRRGEPDRPIVVRGVPGPKGELPRIDGSGAVAAAGLDYSGDVRAVIKIGTARVPQDTMPSDIVLEGLDIANASPGVPFKGCRGPAVYSGNATSLWVEKGERITIRNCVLHGSANGLFVSPGSRQILVDGCRIFGNGVEKDIYTHNVYTEANGIVFRNNRFGPLRPGSLGNNLKDRSAGLVVSDNWIEGGTRVLDLVDAEDSVALQNLPEYRETRVSGNVLVKLPGGPNKQVVHYGGDSGKKAGYRKGTLRFFNNTVISRRPDGCTVFRLDTEDEHVEARNNVFFTEGRGKNLAILDSAGVVDLSGNWLSAGWAECHGKLTGSIRRGEGNVEGATPGFRNAAKGDYRVAAGKGIGAPDAVAGGMR